MTESFNPGRFTLVIFLAATVLLATNFTAVAYDSYYDSRCVSCHYDDSETCNGCHHHGNYALVGTPNKDGYEPGEEVIVTFDGGRRQGWVRGRMLDHEGTEVARKTGPTFTGNDGGPQIEFPMELRGYAPGESGSYSWTAKYYGNENGGGHSEFDALVSIQVSSTADIVVNAIPAISPMFFGTQGGTIEFDVSLENTTGSAVPFDGWIDVTLPMGVHYGPIFGPISAGLPGGVTITRDISLNLPASAPPGVYSLNVYIGDYDGSVVYDADSFAFVKQSF
jgi:hypothetical protein